MTPPATRRWRRCFLVAALCFSVGAALVLPLLLGAPDPPPAGLRLSADPARLPGFAAVTPGPGPACATVEEMGRGFGGGGWGRESLRVRRIFRDHFAVHVTNGTSEGQLFYLDRKKRHCANGSIERNQLHCAIGCLHDAQVANQLIVYITGSCLADWELPPNQFCRRRFVLGKASEAGFGNEMYKILTAAALSVLLNRSLIIGQTRGKYPFGDYVSYANLSFTLREVKHLWRQNDCFGKYRKQLIIRTDDFERPAETNVLCSDWRTWKHPIIWFQGTTDAIAIQFFLKNVHPGMRKMASSLFGDPRFFQNRPNVFGELIRFIVSPSEDVQEAVNWVIAGGGDPLVTVHMRMMMNRSRRAVRAAINCMKKALSRQEQRRPRLVLVSDTPSVVDDIKSNINEFAEVLHFDYKSFKGNISTRVTKRTQQVLEFRAKDWGPAPRWVMFVDFFLASRAKLAVISGANRRVGTTYAQLVAALAAANQLGEDPSDEPKFSFFSSFQSNLLEEGLAKQVGWGHAWNRYAGPLSCRKQRSQCALTRLLPSGWWDDPWQSPIPRDVRRMQSYGVHLTDSGEVIDSQLQSFCKSRREVVKTIPVYGHM